MKPKTAKLKPRKMWANYYEKGVASFPSKSSAIKDDKSTTWPVVSHVAVPVVVIPLDDVEKLVRKAGDAFAESHDGSLHTDDIRAALSAIGIPAKRRVKGGRK